MSKWLNLIEKDESKVDDFIKHFENELIAAQEEILIGDRIISEARRLPHIVDFRFGQLQEIDAVYELMDIKLKEIRSHLHRHYLTNYQHKLVSRDVDRFVEGEITYVDAMIKRNKVNLIRSKFESVTKGLEYKNFQITNIVKLKAAGVDDLI